MQISIIGFKRATLVSTALLGAAVGSLACTGTDNPDPIGAPEGDLATAVRELGAMGPAAGRGRARQLAPLSGSVTGSRRPLLRWSGPNAAVIQICADHACGQPLSVFVATGRRAQPPRALPPGVVFWRVIALGAPFAIQVTPTWELFVPPAGANAVATRGLRYDANADGFADAAVRAQNGNAATDVLHVFTGGPGGVSPTRDLTRTLDTTTFGVGFAAAGDTNGDGFGDFAVADGRGVVVYAGSATGPGAAPLAVIPVPSGTSPFSFGFALSGLGDVDGDGYGELLVSDGSSRAWVFPGGATGPSPTPVWVATAPAGRSLRLMTAGDFNGDGFGDVVLVDSGPDGTPQGFRFFPGSAGGLEAPTAGTFLERPSFPTGTAGDVNGDGTMDLVTAEGTTLNLFPGGAAFPIASPSQVVTVPARPGPVQMGDFDGDGAFDLAATTSTPTSSMFFTDDRVDIYLGGPSGLGASPAETLAETSFLPDNQLIFGLRLGNGDVDRDGREDLIVGSPPPFPTPFFDTSASAVFVFPGAAGGVSPIPARLDGTPGFGNAVSAGVPQSGP
jgi:hypothetical protein